MKNEARAIPADPEVTVNIDLRESSIIKNSVLNFLGLALPKLVALLAIPFTIRLLGMDRFGILSLIFVVFGYFSFLDLGLSVATVRYIAQAIATKKFELVPKYLWATATFQFFLGLAGGLILTASSSLIAGRILKIPPGLISESKTALIILGLSLPIVLVSASFRGALEAAQRFDLVNIIKAPSSVLNYVMPLVAAALGFGLPGIVVFLFIVRFLTLIAYLACCFRIYPNLRFFIAFDKEAAKPIFKYGIWVQISNIVGPVIAYLERFMIGALLTVQMVSYFTAPGEAIMSLAIIPNSLLITLFPAFSALDGRQDDTMKNRFFGLSLKILLIVSGLVSIILIFFAKEFLTVWLGADFAGTCTGIFRIMVLLFFLNALTNIPYSVLQGIGRVDIMAKLYITELVISVPLAWVLIRNWGLMGATLSWAARIVVETPLLFAVSMRLGKIKASSLVGGRIKQAAVGLAILAAAGFILKPIPWGQPVFVAFVVLFFAGLWTAVMEAKEKAWILAQIRSWKTRLSFKGK